MSITAYFLSKNIAPVRNNSAAPFAKTHFVLTAASAASLLIFWRSGSVHSSAAPFAKSHFVLTAASAASLLIYGRSGSVHSSAAPFAKSHFVLTAAPPPLCSYTGAHSMKKDRRKTVQARFSLLSFFMAELLLYIPLLILGYS